MLSPLPSTAVYVPGRRGRHTNGKGVYGPLLRGGSPYVRFFSNSGIVPHFADALPLHYLNPLCVEKDSDMRRSLFLNLTCDMVKNKRQRLRQRGGDRIYEMRCLFVAVRPNAVSIDYDYNNMS